MTVRLSGNNVRFSKSKATRVEMRERGSRGNSILSISISIVTPNADSVLWLRISPKSIVAIHKPALKKKKWY